jgi:hypothetical protein
MNPFQVLITPSPAFAIADVWGEVTLPNVLELISRLDVDSRAVGYKAVLINFLDADGALGEHERRLAGEVAGQRLRHLRRVATVVRRETITGTTAAAAAEQGLVLRTFESMGEAVRWLTT